MNRHFIHQLSKDARRRIIEILVSKRSFREAASALGITPAAIAKYLSGRTHPSDEVLSRALEYMSHEELYEASKIIFEDLLQGLEGLLAWADDYGLIDRAIERRLEELSAKIKLSSLRRGRMSFT